MAEEDILAQAATATQGMIPGIVQQQHQQDQGMTTFGPTPLVQPPPIPRFQPPQQGDRQTHFETVGSRKRADKQAAINGIANFVKSGTDYLAAKKQRALSMDIQRLMEAQQGMQEAKQTLQQNPNDPAAKEALERNTGIINDITADPKKSKLLQKAFNIDLFGDGKNKQENMALIDAWKQFEQKKQAGDKTALNPVASKMMQQQPMTQQMSPEAAQQAAAIKAGLIPKADELMKAQMEVYKAISSAKTSEDKDKAIVDAAKIRAEAEEKHAGALVDAANVRKLGQQGAAEIHSRAQRYIADKVAATWDKRIAALGTIAGNKNTTDKDKAVLGSLNKEATTFNNQLKILAEENTKLQAELDKKGSTLFGMKLGAATGADAKMMRIKIGANNAAMRAIQQSLDNTQKKLQTLQGMGILSLGSSEDGTPVGDSNTSTEVSDDEVPE